MPVMIDLKSPDGNAYSIMSITKQILTEIGKSDRIPEYMEKATNVKYKQLLELSKEYTYGIIEYCNNDLVEPE